MVAYSFKRQFVEPIRIGLGLPPLVLPPARRADGAKPPVKGNAVGLDIAGRHRRRDFAGDGGGLIWRAGNIWSGSARR